MATTHFNPTGELIIVESKIWGPRGATRLSFALDTASAATVVAPHAVDGIGYSPRHGIAMTTVRSAVGKEHGYTLKVARMASLGFVMQDFEVNVFDLATGHGIDGLIGLSFLRHFDYKVHSIVGKISVRPAMGEARPSE